MYVQVGFKNEHGEWFELRKEHGVVYVNGDEYNWEDQPLFPDFRYSDEELIKLGEALITLGKTKC